MARRKKQFGKCKLCKEEKDLNFEHVPPRSAFNKNTRFSSIPSAEYYAIENILENPPKGKVQQGGLGYYAYCENCNNFLGRNYVPAYEKWVHAISSINTSPGDYVRFTLKEINPLRISKQIISMFIAINDHWYGNEYFELLEYVKDPSKKGMPNKFRLFFYLNSIGQLRNNGFSVQFSPEFGHINCSEITFPPLGYVMTYDYEFDIPWFTEITNFIDYEDEDINFIPFAAINLETHLAGLPLDYRKKETIQNAIDSSLKFSNELKRQQNNN